MNKRQLNILIAEDNQMLGKCLKDIIKNTEHRLSFFEDGSSVIEFLVNNNDEFDYAFIDYCMPGAKGDEVIKKLLEVNCGLFKKVFLFTGMASTDGNIKKFLDDVKDITKVEYMQKSPLTLKYFLDNLEKSGEE